MTHARLAVELPEGSWIGDVSRRYTDASFRVQAALPGDGPGYAIVNLTAPDAEAVIDAMDRHAAMSDLSVLARSDREATVQFETSAPMLVRAAKRAGVPLRMPVEIDDGEAIVSIAGASDRLPELGARLEELGLTYRVERVRESDPSGRSLTERQRETVLAAITHGYYDTPRRCTLTELAEEIGVAKSTVSQTLHRAEEVVVKSSLACEETAAVS